MKLTRLILILVIANLFFIGLLVGMNFSKQNPLAELQAMSNNPAINYHSLTPMERSEVFLIRLRNAGNLTVNDIYQHWVSLYKNPKLPVFFSNAKLLLEEQLSKKKNTAAQSRVTIVKTTIPSHELVDHSVNQVSSSLQPTPDQEKPLSSPSSEAVKGRTDPFLTLGKKFQIKVGPFEKRKPALIETPEINGNLPIIGNSKADLYPEVKSAEIQEKTKVVEKPGSKILKDFTLRGVVIGDRPTAYVEDRNGYHKLMIGDSLGEGKVTAIAETSITIKVADEEIVLQMEGLK